MILLYFVADIFIFVELHKNRIRKANLVFLNEIKLLFEKCM